MSSSSARNRSPFPSGSKYIRPGYEYSPSLAPYYKGGLGEERSRFPYERSSSLYGKELPSYYRSKSRSRSPRSRYYRGRSPRGQLYKETSGRLSPRVRSSPSRGTTTSMQRYGSNYPIGYGGGNGNRIYPTSNGGNGNGNGNGGGNRTYPSWGNGNRNGDVYPSWGDRNSTYPMSNGGGSYGSYGGGSNVGRNRFGAQHFCGGESRYSPIRQPMGSLERSPLAGIIAGSLQGKENLYQSPQKQAEIELKKSKIIERVASKIDELSQDAAVDGNFPLAIEEKTEAEHLRMLSKEIEHDAIKKLHTGGQLGLGSRLSAPF